MRVAFTLIGGTGWTGGLNYLENLLSAISESGDSSIEIILFVGTDTDQVVIDRLSPFLSIAPIKSSAWNNNFKIRFLKLFCGFVLQRDYLSESEFKCQNIDIVFQHQAWYGCWFKVPTLAWIADFQHRRVPTMFSRTRFMWRDIGYRALSYCASRIMVSSEDAKNDCEKYYPKSKGSISVLPFVVKTRLVDPMTKNHIRQLYNLPEKFFYLPNQLWKHKNHLGIIEALRILKKENRNIVIIASGKAQDIRHPAYPQHLLSLVEKYELESYFKYLGFIPYEHIAPLMTLSLAVVNPSFCEGWSTTVEEAKSMGVPLLLSRLPIHHEQTDGNALFFDPTYPADMACILRKGWSNLPVDLREGSHLDALNTNTSKRRELSESFIGICTSMLN